jgi:hypothetical protein
MKSIGMIGRKKLVAQPNRVHGTHEIEEKEPSYRHPT